MFPSPCPAGCFCNATGMALPAPCPAGTYSPESGAGNSSSCRICDKGFYCGSFGQAFETPCPAGNYCPSSGMSSYDLCQPGYYCPPSAVDPIACPPGHYCPDPGLSAPKKCEPGTYNPSEGSQSCISCPAGSSCEEASVIPCACKVFYYSKNIKQSKCELCPLPSSLTFGANSCFSQAAPSQDMYVYYYLLAAIFSCIAVQAAFLTARLMRLLRGRSLRTVRAGMCLYIAMFVPYAVLQAITLSKLAGLSDSSVDLALERNAAQLLSRAAFAAFFGLGFSGKVALVQMWTHVVRLHASGGYAAPPLLQNALMSTYKAFVWAVVVIVVLYLSGFIALTNRYMASFGQCSRLQTEVCVPYSEDMEQPCSDSVLWSRALLYYEGSWAGVVLVVFTLLAFLFNGVVFAMCVRHVMRCAAVLSDAWQVD
jgi:hypothetical protein